MTRITRITRSAARLAALALAAGAVLAHPDPEQPLDPPWPPETIQVITRAGPIPVGDTGVTMIRETVSCRPARHVTGIHRQVVR